MWNVPASATPSRGLSFYRHRRGIVGKKVLGHRENGALMNQRVLDYEEFISGFQSARDAAIADSRFRHEQVEFDRLCVQLAKQAWSACLESQNPDEARLAGARWRDAHLELACSQQRVRPRPSGAEEPALTFACVCAACGALP